MPSVLISAGEVSGDLHGAHLVQEMRKQAHDLQFFGIGGNEMRASGVELHYHIERMGIVGITEAIRHVWSVRRVLNKLRELMEQRRPHLAILIDYPGFNLRLAKMASQMSIPVLYYIAPQVWAWGIRRIKAIARYTDTVAVILPFEVSTFRKAGIDAEFVGHPLLERLGPTLEQEQFFVQYGLKDSSPILGLLPGSRPNEIRRLLPVMLKSANIIQQKVRDLEVMVAAASQTDAGQIEETIRQGGIEARVLHGFTPEIISYSDLLLVASGTATLEAACHGTPSLILYKVSFITWLAAKLLVHVPHIGLVNIVAKKEIVPEYIQFDATPEKIASGAIDLLNDEKRRQNMRFEMKKVREKLGEPGASVQTARIALDMLMSQSRSSPVKNEE